MVDLPDEAARAELLEALAGLVERHGRATLLLPPLTPTTSCFPDRWQPNAAGVTVLAQRLLGYAGLPRLRPEVGLWSDVSPQLRARSRTHALGHTAALFLGLDGDRARFAVEAGHLEDPEATVAAMAHEVAHAWRAWHGEVVEDQRHEEELTDLTTVYLGFGVLTANAAYRYRSRGGYGYMEWSQQQLGYLGPGSLTFLLAAQAVARGAGWRERRRILADLEPNQAGAFAAGLRALRPEAEALRRRLGGPSVEERPPPRALPSVAPPVAPVAHPDFPDAPGAWNAGRPVFRVPRSRLAPLVGMPLAAVIPGVLFAVLAGSALGGAPGAQIGAVVGLVASPLLGLWLGARAARRVQDDCSDPDCKASLPAGVQECPVCGGVISGTIRRPEDRLEAEEALRSSRRPRASTGAERDSGRAR
jgi:hypothetical protein